MLNLLITLIIGFAGGSLAMRLKVPAGTMIGAMLSVALFNILTGNAYLPQDVRIFTQIGAGAFIGTGIRYRDILDLRYVMKPAVVMVFGMLTLSILMGIIMSKLTGLDFITTLFACAPGGIVDMSLVSHDMGADTSKVAILQLVRLMCVMTLFPPMIKFISFRFANKAPAKAAENNVEEAGNARMDVENAIVTWSIKDKSVNLALTLSVSLAAGFLGYLVKIPAGTMTFSMIAAALLNVFWGRGYMPVGMRKAIQLLAGILIGAGMTYDSLVSLTSVLIPALILLIGFVIMNLFLGFLISRISKIDLTTALFASAPAGMSDMALIAGDLGADGPKVVILQLARLVSVLAVYPIAIKFISSIL